MKTVAIGDIHGRGIWRNIIEQEQPDMTVFIGDYFDTHDNISVAQQMYNFNSILRYKKEHIDKAILLVGNHDYHYMRGIKEHYSGYQAIYAIDIQERLEYALKNALLQLCYMQDGIIFVHAGFTKTWMNEVMGYEEFSISDINEMFENRPHKFGFRPGVNWSQYGDDITQSPIWVRPYSLMKDCLTGYRQVVGHTQVDKLDINNDIVLIDTLGTSEEYLVINYGVMAVNSIVI
jgi:hypothetical protein